MTSSQLLASITKSAGKAGGKDSGTGGYSVLVAKTEDEVVAAQRLRHQVFGVEMGAKLHSPVDGLDVDEFDQYCDHIVVREDATGEIVGTYRMLPPERAAEAGKLYSDTEFDLSNLAELRGSLVETGRSCVHADHRTGAVVSLVWTGIARYMVLSGHRYLAGCASVPLADGGSYAASVWDMLQEKYYADESLRVHPHHPWRTEGVPRVEKLVLPPLVRGYLRLGARVCGPPAHDPDFNVADFFVLLDIHSVDERYVKFFLGAQ
ncbi:GNAT family N-acyltransferase [Thermocrispum sp.]|jgi:putative hemolysin|uniref:GNAT family N-acetyltransferase n=2 Tax=Thermocrispum agreste TaxID=37925 RepID=A0A2W4ITT0_9PSEU|nr:GNAT family N-acyltransferase [Thermocrispum sp.]PZM89971.1 MAG: GNAT family N-acetyltransferase [Thermocrispum agreste]